VLVDAHCHLLPRDYPADSPSCFPSMAPVDGRAARLLVFGRTRYTARDVYFDAARRVEAMDASGVTVEVVTPMPPLLRYDLPVADGLSLCRYVNEWTASWCAAVPDRMIGFGIVPMQDPEAAAGELMSIVEHGLRGVEIASNVLGASIGDERFLPFFAEAQRLDLPIFVHAMPAATDRLPSSATGTYVVGLEGALAAASLIAGGIAATCPDLRISFSHAAGGFPLMVPRAQYFWSGAWNEERVVPERAIAHDDGPSPLEYARRFYYDAMVFDRRAMRYVVDLIGHDRILLGSDFPAMPREDPMGRTARSLDLPPEQWENMRWHNAFRYLGMTPPTATA
jgi:aminocarboxymuconate-semialdehyde decarboxylase